MKPFFSIILALAAWANAGANLQADILVFANGDRLNGDLVEQTAQTIRFHSASLGLINVPAPGAHIEPSPPAKAPAAPDAAKQTASDQLVKNSPTFTDRLKSAINRVLPGEVTGRLDAGITNTRSNASTSQIISVGNLTVKNAPDTYDLKGFYYYTATRASDGTLSRSADRYGANTSYRHDLSERLFVNDDAGYLRDFKANINHQAQDTLNGGYVVWKSARANLSLQAGPTQRYQDADGIATKWRTLGGGKQVLKWRFSDTLRLEQDSAAQGQLDEFDNHSWGVSAALINNLDRNLELALRFSQTYNTLVGVNGARSEQVLALTLGVTF